MGKFSFKEAAAKNKKLKYGGYMTVIILFAVIAFVVVNILFQQLKINVDLTPEKLYSISSKTKLLLDDVEDDISIYGLYVNGNENNEAIALINDYIQNCRKITFKQVDPYVNPEFTEPYRQDSETIPTRSLIVVNENSGKFKILGNNDLYEYTQTVNQETYAYDYTITAFKAEEVLTSAIQYVTNEHTPVVYTVTGHSEAEMSSDLKGLLEKANYTFESLNLLTDGESLEANDWTVVIFNNPLQDMSEYEYDAIMAYMENGGSTVLNLSAQYPAENMPYFNKFMERYGITPVKGTIIETDPNNYLRYPYLVLPNVGISEITTDVPNSSVVSLLSLGLHVSDERNRATEITPLLTTSDGAVAKAKEEFTVFDYEDGDEKGPFYLGVQADEEVSRDGSLVKSSLVVYGSSLMFDNNNGYMTSGNYNLLSGTLNYMQNELEAVYVSPKEYVNDTLNVSAQSMVIGGLVFVILIPLGIIVLGLVIWGRRKRL